MATIQIIQCFALATLLIGTTFSQINGQRKPLLAPAKAVKSPTETAVGDQQQYMTAPQCRCKDLDECAKEIDALVAKCKTEPKCEAHLKKIGQAPKIRQCLSDEQADMKKLEQCVEKMVGPIGCTNEANPKNLTIPVIPEMMQVEDGRSKRAAAQQIADWDFEDEPIRFERGAQQVPALPATQEAGHAPPELSDFLMCVDQCAVEKASPDQAPKLCATRDGNMNCAFKLKCALAPPDEKQEKAFADCEQKLALTAQQRLKKSCECLKAAGVKIVCPK